MAEYLSPGVFIEEVPSGIKPIEGVSTSVGAFVGHAEKGPLGEAVPINNFAQFYEKFGGYIENGYLAYAVKAFFDEGGTTCYVVRTCHYSSGVANASSITLMTAEVGGIDALKIEAESPGKWGDDLSVKVEQVDPDVFTLTVFYKGQQVEQYKKMTMDRSHDNYVVKVVERDSRYIAVEDQTAAGSTLTAAARRPRDVDPAEPLTGGSDGLSSTSPSSDDYIGNGANGRGLHAFDKVDGVNIVAIPDAPNRTTHNKGMAYCANRGDCFYAGDSQETISNADDVLHYKLARGIYTGENAINSKYGALYTPWIWVFDPRTGGRIKIPPSGAVAGRYASVDKKRGVHKAPAGTEDGRLGVALDVGFEFSQADQEKLNPKGIDVIRKIKGVGSVIWGARTVSSDPEWRYLNVRRLFLFLEESIEKSTSWVVFEPNDQALWKSLVRNVSAFLKIQWMAGALVGATEEEAYYVKCDEETNPPESVDLGRVITEIGVAPSKPAEFVVFRISQKPGGSEVEE